MQKRWNVYITRNIPDAAVELLKKHCDAEVNMEDRALEKVKGNGCDWKKPWYNWSRKNRKQFWEKGKGF